jgi:Domain of unknown function (DUF3883)
MEAVMEAERALGFHPVDVSAHKRGWDIESRDPRGGPLRFIEVKGRHAEGRDLILTKNELIQAMNVADQFVLAIVQIDSGFAREPVYVRRFFNREVGFGETAVVFSIDDLISLGRAASHG